MKTWLVIVSVVAVLLAAGAGVGFQMLTDTKAELTDTKAELAEIQETLEENFGYWPVETTGAKYAWCEGIEETISDLELRVEELEGTIGDLEGRVGGLEDTLRRNYIR